MSDEAIRDYGREVRGTIVKSSLTGVGITVLAVAALSPAGFGGMIGTSVASALGEHNTTTSADPYANLPPYPSLLSQSEISDIRGQIAATTAAMEITRAATEDKIEFVHDLAMHPGALSVAPMTHFAKADVAPHETRTAQAAAPAAPAAPATSVTAAAAAPSSATQVATVTPAVAQIAAAPIAPISFDTTASDPHLELATLLLGDN